MPNRVGEQLGNYRLLRLLGEGGFAQVYLGEHLYLGTQAALKVLSASLSAKDSKDFQREAYMVAHLIHPHIVRVLEFGVEGTIPFLVMDYAPGGTLRQLYPKGSRVPLDTIHSYTVQVATALQYAHQKQVIHRDIKPENMLLGEDYQILLSDFGLAQTIQNSYSQSTQEFAGTIAYMAPEHIQGKPHFASDQYSLGVVVYEWLCGLHPFQGSFIEVCTQHLYTPPPSLREQVPTIPSSVEDVVMKALAKNRHERFSTMQAFATALGQACQSQTSQMTTSPTPPIISSHPVSPMPLPPPIVSTSPSPFRSPTTDMTHRRQEAPPTSQIQHVQLPLLPSDSQILPTYVVRPISEIPSFSQVSQLQPPPPPPQILQFQPTPPPPQVPQLQPPPSPRSMPRRIFILGGIASLAGLTIGTIVIWRTLPLLTNSIVIPPTFTFYQHISKPPYLLYTYNRHRGAIYQITWSPDGTRIASSSTDDTVQVWGVANGAKPYVYTGHNSSIVNTVAWSPDGIRIASAGNDTTVQVWDAINGAHPYVYKGHANAVYRVAWSPDSTRIASAGFDTTVHVWNAVNGTNFYLYKGHSNAINSVAWSPDGTRIASAGFDTTVHVWDAANGATLYIYKEYPNTLRSVIWSPDSTRIACAGDDTTVHVWDAADGAHLYIYKGHSRVVYDVAWSPDGTRIASASNDGTVQIWNATDGTPLDHYPYQYKGNGAYAVAWSPNGKRIAFGGSLQLVEVWQIR